MRRSIRDTEVFRPRDTRGRIQGSIFGILSGTCVLFVVGAWLARSPFMIHYPVFEVGLFFGLSRVWMVQLG